MMDSELDALTDVYLRDRGVGREEDFWAWEKVDRRVKVNFAEAWAVTQALVTKANADSELGYVAASPLEDLLDSYGDAA